MDALSSCSDSSGEVVSSSGASAEAVGGVCRGVSAFDQASVEAVEGACCLGYSSVEGGKSCVTGQVCEALARDRSVTEVLVRGDPGIGGACGEAVENVSSECKLRVLSDEAEAGDNYTSSQGMRALSSVGEATGGDNVNMSSPKEQRALSSVGEAKGFDAVNMSIPKAKRALSSVGEERGSDIVNTSLPNTHVRYTQCEVPFGGT